MWELSSNFNRQVFSGSLAIVIFLSVAKSAFAAPFDLNAPHEVRLKQLAPYFDPVPGTSVTVPDDQVREFGKKDRHNGNLFGLIRVTPPKGYCFTVTRDLDRSDVEICKSTTLKWLLRDLDPHTGRLHWTVKTSSKDFGVRLMWSSEYRIAKFIPAGFEFDEASSTPMFIKSCRAEMKNAEAFKSRRVTLEFFTGESWVFRFPDEDEGIPAYIPPPPPPPVDPKAAAKAKPTDEKPAPVVRLEPWTLSTRRGFQMNVSQVIPGEGALPGGTGKCRYQYDGIIGDDTTGRIECHYADHFLYFYAQMPCLRFIKPKI